MASRAYQLIQEAQRVKNALELAGYLLTDIDRDHGLARGASGDALRNPNARAESAVAKVLGVEPKDLWPSRYDTRTSKRHSPQPSVNYARPPAIRQRRKDRAKLAGAN